MAFSTTSRSFTNLGNASTDIHRNSSAAAHTNSLGNGAGPWGNKTASIWGSGNATFVPRTVSDKSQPRDLSVDTTDIKKGSGSLLASSESDSWRPGTRGDSAVRIPAQPYRNNSTVDASRSTSGGSTNISPTTTRAPAINLTNTAFSASRPSFTSAQSAGFFGGEPPNVYPKYKERQGYPVDSVLTPSSTSASPISERRPQWPSQYRDSITVTNSCDQSRAPTSSHSDRQFSFSNDYSRTQRQTPASGRAASISSQTSYNNVAINSDYLPPAFNQLSLDRPTSRGMQNGYKRVAQMEHMDDTDRFTIPGYNNFNSLYSTPTIDNFAFARLQDSTPEFRPGQNFQLRDPRIEEFVPSKQSWQEHDMSIARRTPVQQPLIDPRLAAQVMALKDQYSVYNPYTVPSLQSVAPYIGYYHMGLGGLNPTLPTPPSELESGLQSAKLYDFKLAGKNNKRYELKDIYDHIAEFAGDQHGSRFIQNKLETANSDEKERVFREIEPNAIPLMTDVFGNYVIQKFFDHGHQEHKKILAHKMRGQVLNLSTQMYGCRVVQKALEHVLLEQQAALVGELEHHVLKCVKDQNGNHVIQKAIERCPTETIGFVYQAFIGQVHSLSLHPYGCRVIQRCLERQEWFPAKSTILAELHDSMAKGMIGDSYGNYVVQHVVENGPEPDRQHVLGIVLSDLEGYSKHKFASNVVEKCIQHSNDMWRRRVVEILTTVDHRRAEGEGVLIGLIRDSFGNYVIQKLLDSLSAQDFLYFHQHLAPAMAHTKRTGSGKQVVSIEKKMQRFENLMAHPPAFQLSIPPTAYQGTYDSVSNTPPPLTADSRSMQSSGIPSINGDAVEGATSMSGKGSEAPIDPMLR